MFPRSLPGGPSGPGNPTGPEKSRASCVIVAESDVGKETVEHIHYNAAYRITL